MITWTIERLHVGTWLGLGLMALMACATQPIPESSLTGRVTEVQIEPDGLTPSTVRVAQGDEVRWINKTKGFADVTFMQSLSDIVSCRKGFQSVTWGSSATASGIKYLFVSRLASQDSAGLCFTIPGTFQYAVETDEATTGKATRMHGTITIE